MTSQDVILGILMKRSLSGYDIKHLLESVFSYFYNASYGTIYPTLSKMEKDGLITKESVLQEGRPNKNIYTITEEGRKQFRAYMYSPMQANEFKSDGMTRLFFGEFVDPEVIARYLEHGIAGTKETLARLQKMYEDCKDTMSPTQEICILIGIENNESTLRTLGNGLDRLNKLKLEKRLDDHE
ncbi:helix-turn-helix transcriptional regulator [Paenibacillus sedimenti]|uniref:PadR family transcriptional regulator n=1 Tax=Paenibacillus sedimenti TaxID=2770274 RepID=A0A926KLS5_9BACL|nr:helix-turn-helix transcriptional regulator [Paenibacillus sedimenti]MBD0379473.1 PadR family transcriptional regulator [Paenibacillus sedimenti]